MWKDAYRLSPSLFLPFLLRSLFHCSLDFFARLHWPRACGTCTKCPSERVVRLIESQIKVVRKGRGQLWVPVLPRCSLGGSQLCWLFFNYKITVLSVWAVQTLCPTPAWSPSDILVEQCRMADCRSQFWISAHYRNVVTKKETLLW